MWKNKEALSLLFYVPKSRFQIIKEALLMSFNITFIQNRSQSHRPGRARAPLSSFFHQISINCTQLSTTPLF